MDYIIRLIRRYIGTTVVISLLLLTLNLVMLGTVLFQEAYEKEAPASVLERIAASLVWKDIGYVLGEAEQQWLEQNHAWAMLLSEDGAVKWEYRLPEEIPRSYTLSEVAKFSRNYLMDYPVFVWEQDEGILVVGYPKNSYAKYQLIYPVSWISSLPSRVVLVLVGNMTLVLILSIIVGTRLIRSIRPLVSGVHALAKEEEVHVECKGIFSDLAHSINQASDKLQEKNAALKARDEARSNWIAGISHDIRTPLSMVLGYASDLEENSALPDEGREQAGIIRRQGEKLRSLIQDLNLVSMLEYEMQPLDVKLIRLSAVARQVVTEFLNHGLEEDRYHLILKITDESIRVQADIKLLQRAVTNLVQNSIAHNPQGCVIWIETGLGPDSQKGLIVVSDNGTGIPEEELPDLLELPYSSRRKRPVSHRHGLGLPMVARIAKAHQGRLTLQSGAGQGLRAEMEFPLCNEQQEIHRMA